MHPQPHSFQHMTGRAFRTPCVFEYESPDEQRLRFYQRPQLTKEEERSLMAQLLEDIETKRDHIDDEIFGLNLNGVDPSGDASLTFVPLQSQGFTPPLPSVTSSNAPTPTLVPSKPLHTTFVAPAKRSAVRSMETGYRKPGGGIGVLGPNGDDPRVTRRHPSVRPYPNISKWYGDSTAIIGEPENGSLLPSPRSSIAGSGTGTTPNPAPDDLSFSSFSPDKGDVTEASGKTGSKRKWETESNGERPPSPASKKIKMEEEAQAQDASSQPEPTVDQTDLICHYPDYRPGRERFFCAEAFTQWDVKMRHVRDIHGVHEAVAVYAGRLPLEDAPLLGGKLTGRPWAPVLHRCDLPVKGVLKKGEGAKGTCTTVCIRSDAIWRHARDVHKLSQTQFAKLRKGKEPPTPPHPHGPERLKYLKNTHIDKLRWESVVEGERPAFTGIPPAPHWLACTFQSFYGPLPRSASLEDDDEQENEEVVGDNLEVDNIEEVEMGLDSDEETDDTDAEEHEM